MTIELSTQQETAVRTLQGKLAKGQPLVTLGGYAGSGKSTIIPHVVDKLDLSSTAFVCFTGKASQVLRSKLQAAGVADAAAYVGTIHGLMYWDKVPELRNSKTGNKISHIVVDEASMVGKSMFDDLLGYGAQVLAVGDPAQLPPVQDISVMLSPDFVLTEVHRQAEGSPIIRVATHVREHGRLPNTDDIKRITYEQADEAVAGLGPMDWAVLTRSNRVRVYLNEMLCGKTPKIGSTVVCLRNYWDLGLYNGLRGTVVKAQNWEGRAGGLLGRERHHQGLLVDFPDRDAQVLVSDVNLRQFNREQAHTAKSMREEHQSTVGKLFNFGAALTVHKAQGSGFHTVMIVPESWDWNRNEAGDYQKWLYTAVTRATDNVYFLPEG
jgi:exodeoxyribonuclease V